MVAASLKVYNVLIKCTLVYARESETCYCMVIRRFKESGPTWKYMTSQIRAYMEIHDLANQGLHGNT